MILAWRKLSLADKRYVALVVLAIFAGFALRIYGLPSNGTFADLILINSWGRVVTFYGWADSYRHGIDGFGPTNYPPLNTAIFGAVTTIHNIFFGIVPLHASSLNAVMKIPAIFADIWISLCAFAFLRRYIPLRKALIAGTMCWLYPSYWLLSSYWGQTDSIFSSLSFGSLAACLLGLPFFAGFFLALSLLTKVQGVIIAPVIVVLLMQEKKYVVQAILGAFIPCVIVLTPFFLADRLTDVVSIYTDIPDIAPLLSNRTYNAWWALFALSSAFIADSVRVGGVVSMRMIGYVLTSACYVSILWRLYVVIRLHPQHRRIVEASLAAAALCSLAFFLLMTRMHTRYFFAFVPCVLVLWHMRREGHRHVLILLSTFCINLLGMMYFYSSVDGYYGLFGFILAWINVLVTADLAHVWWQTILNPAQSDLKHSVSRVKYDD